MYKLVKESDNFTISSQSFDTIREQYVFGWFVLPTCHCIYYVLTKRIDKTVTSLGWSFHLQITCQNANKEPFQWMWQGNTRVLADTSWVNWPWCW